MMIDGSVWESMNCVPDRNYTELYISKILHGATPWVMQCDKNRDEVLITQTGSLETNSNCIESQMCCPDIVTIRHRKLKA